MGSKMLYYFLSIDMHCREKEEMSISVVQSQKVERHWE